MSLFDKASLVVTPNGVKEGKLYSIKPTDGSGDLNVVRATTATRVNSDGLIEVTPYNLFTYSEQFDNASWIKNNSTIAPNNIVSPNGTLTADKLVENTSNTTHSVIKPFVVTSGVNYNFSVFLKKAERSKALLLFFGGFPTTTFQIDLDNKSISTQTGTPINAFIQEYNDQWFRVGFSLTANSSTSCNFTIYTSIDGLWANRSYLGDGTSGIYIWGAQLEVGTSAKDYFPTTDRLNIPRLDYTNGSCPSILVEPQRTNLVTYSNDFTNWSGSGYITANYDISPDGTQNASRCLFTGANQILANSSTLSTGVACSATIYIKGTSGETIQLASGGVDKKHTLNGSWQRIETNATSINSTILLNTFGGATARDILIYGAQLEVGSYATSYIPTVASAVTRNADLISKSGISDLIGQTEGTMFVDGFVNKLSTGVFLNLYNASTLQRFSLEVSPTNSIRLYVNDGAASSLSSTSIPLGRVKIAVSYEDLNFKFYVNGNYVGQITDTNVPITMNKINLGSLFNGTFQIGDFLNLTILWKTQLTNEQLAELTTL